MEKLKATLEEQLAHLNELAVVVAQEQQLLCAGRLEGMVLQSVTDKKSSLLTRLSRLDQERVDEESVLGLEAPYPGVLSLSACWQKIQQQIKPLHAMNLHNGMLLNHHVNHNTKALAVLNASHSAILYGADGRACKLNWSGGRRIGV